jgi:CelD/BcsL family acetyltransferase involved in cellulose biosynthesis
LISENTDIAGAIVYKYKSIGYIAQITYRPTHLEYSPGVILNVEIIKALFGTHYKEFDFLGLRGDEKNFLKKNWSTGTRQTITIQIYNRNLRRYLSVMGKNAKTVSLKVMRMVTDYNLSQQAQTEEASP